MSIIDNVSSITLLPIESLFREMSKAPICEIKVNEKKLIAGKNICITYEQLLSTLIFPCGLKGNPFSLRVLLT